MLIIHVPGMVKTKMETIIDIPIPAMERPIIAERFPASRCLDMRGIALAETEEVNVIIGSKSELAIEYEIVPESGSLILGHFCMCAKGQTIGDYSDVILLTAVQAQVERSLKYVGLRRDPELFTMDKGEAMHLLQDALYGEGGDWAKSRALSLRYGRFNLKELGISSFDGFFVFLIEGDNGERVLWKKVDESNIEEAIVSLHTYETIANEWLREFFINKNKPGISS